MCLTKVFEFEVLFGKFIFHYLNQGTFLATLYVVEGWQQAKKYGNAVCMIKFSSHAQ